jgi:hypothetical protein
MDNSRLPQIYETLKQELLSISSNFNEIRELPGRIDLVSKRDLVIDGRKRKEIWFCGLIIQSSYVGFYYMPVYARPELKNVFSPKLLKHLKGKSCFHIKELDSELLTDIRSSLQTGIKIYKDLGWI